MNVRIPVPKRASVVFASVALLATLAISGTTAANASGETHYCQGVAATIVSDAAVVIGTPGDDVILGGETDQHIDGLGGDDLICGAGGHDALYGGPGDDKIEGLWGDDHLDGGDGHDVLFGRAGDDVLIGGAGGDTILAGYDDDQVLGTEGHDDIRGSLGDDFILETPGDIDNDSLDGGDGNNERYSPSPSPCGANAGVACPPAVRW